MLLAPTLAAAAEKQPPTHLNCNVYYRQLDEANHILKEETRTGRLDLQAGNQLEFNFIDGSVSAFVCNSDPVSEIDFHVFDRRGHEIGLAQIDPNSSSASLWGTIVINENLRTQIGISCSAPEEK